MRSLDDEARQIANQLVASNAVPTDDLRKLKSYDRSLFYNINYTKSESEHNPVTMHSGFSKAMLRK